MIIGDVYEMSIKVISMVICEANVTLKGYPNDQRCRFFFFFWDVKEVDIGVLFVNLCGLIHTIKEIQVISIKVSLE